VSSSLQRVLAAPVRAELRPLIGSCLASVLRIGADLVRPWPLALAVDYALDARPLDSRLSWATPEIVLVTAGLATVLVTAVGGRLDMMATRSGERAAERIGARLRATVFEHSLTLSLRWHGRVRSGELLSRLTTDVGRLLDAVVATTVSLVPDLLGVIGVLLLLLVLDPGLALLGLVVVPVLAALSVRQRRVVRRTQGDARAAAGRLNGVTADLVRNVAAVQAFGRFDRARHDFGRHNDELLAVEIDAIDTESRWAPRSGLVLAVGAGLVLVIGGLGVRSGLQTTGHLLVVLAYLGELYAPVRGLTRLSVVLAKAGASADRVAEVIESADQLPESPHAIDLPGSATGLELRDVTFGYTADRSVLRGFNLVVRPGESVCLFGPSGAGKSTVLALALRLWDVDSGQVLLGDVDVRDLRIESLRSAVAYVPQDPWLLDATLAQNIAFGSRTATRAEVLAAGRTAWVDEFALPLPLGYDQPLGEGAATLSGGQRRRVAIARATVSAASVLLLDEPTASLDAVSAQRVTDAIRAAARNRTTVIVTHDPALAAVADRVVLLTPGEDDHRHRQDLHDSISLSEGR
jgi:ATP-binding cassette subfamily B protein